MRQRNGYVTQGNKHRDRYDGGYGPDRFHYNEQSRIYSNHAACVVRNGNVVHVDNNAIYKDQLTLYHVFIDNISGLSHVSMYAQYGSIHVDPYLPVTPGKAYLYNVVVSGCRLSKPLTSVDIQELVNRFYWEGWPNRYSLKVRYILTGLFWKLVGMVRSWYSSTRT